MPNQLDGRQLCCAALGFHAAENHLPALHLPAALHREHVRKWRSHSTCAPPSTPPSAAALVAQAHKLARQVSTSGTADAVHMKLHTLEHKHIANLTPLQRAASRRAALRGVRQADTYWSAQTCWWPEWAQRTCSANAVASLSDAKSMSLRASATDRLPYARSLQPAISSLH